MPRTHSLHNLFLSALGHIEIFSPKFSFKFPLHILGCISRSVHQIFTFSNCEEVQIQVHQERPRDKGKIQIGVKTLWPECPSVFGEEKIIIFVMKKQRQRQDLAMGSF